jgi:serine/threonine protein kinase
MRKASTIRQKEFKYIDPKIELGKGKYGPVNLIIVDDDFYALKKVSKDTINNPKRVQHVLNEKEILTTLKK